MGRGFAHASQAMEQCAGKLDVIREELHQAGGHMKNAGRALAGKEALEAQELEADKGALARLRGLFASCGKTFAQMERGAGRLAEKAGGEKSSVKTELRGLKPAQADVYKRQIKSYAAVCLEGAIIVLACIIFSLFAASPPAIDPNAAAVTQVWSYIGELIFNMLILVGAVKMADRVVREMMGL